MVGGYEIKLAEPIQITALTATQVTLNWRDLGAVTQGDNQNERTGSRISPIEAIVKWSFNNASETVAYQCRALLVRLKNYTYNAVPGDADMLVTPSNPAGLLNYGQSVSYKRGKFSQPAQVDILYDSGLIYLNPRGSNQVGPPIVSEPGSNWTKTINLRKRLDPSKQIMYETEVATTSKTNGIHWITWSSNTNINEVGSLGVVFVDP